MVEYNEEFGEVPVALSVLITTLMGGMPVFNPLLTYAHLRKIDQIEDFIPVNGHEYGAQNSFQFA
jgi:hypothetical protein